MSTLESLVLGLNQLFNGEVVRFCATIGVVLTAGLMARFSRAKLGRKSEHESADNLRSKLVWTQNLITLGALFLVTLIWASKIAGVVVSVAALAGAFLIVNKELLMCVMGYGLIVLARPYKIGDYIELGGNAGRVIDINLFSTVLSETGSVNQLTGKTLSFPNGMLFVHPVRNVSATGEFIVSLCRISVPFETDFELAEQCANEAATAATRSWLEQADTHLADIEKDIFLDLPSSRIKVLWETPSEKYHVMTVRFACPVDRRVTTEQEIFRGFWRSFRERAASHKKA